MNGEDLRSAVERLQTKYIGVWEAICALESPTANKAAVDEVGEYCIRFANERGWRVEVFEHSASGNVVCITMNPDAALPPVCFSGHIDTVHPIGLFGYPPVKRDGEKIYGPGVTDCKGGVVAGLLAMEALQACGFEKRPVKMLLQTDEEIGSAQSNKETIRYICEKAKGAVVFFNLEGSINGDVCLNRKGILNFLFTVTGQEAHSSMCALRGANAIVDAAHNILELEKFK
ncbi:MAG: M20/M25/M40 family metallo-hydrolase, partial [Clostridia bacterium]|nr:M20/M25/M40 family metallo-hydrolase [Clostridia bacterium]